MMNQTFSSIVLFALVLFHPPLQLQDTTRHDKGGQSGSQLWSSEKLISPEALRRLLSDGQKGGLTIIHTGPPALFKAGHIPGSLSVGQTSDSSGATKLRQALHAVPRDRKIVLYCGCCPWKNCPNIRPAYTIAREMGSENAKVLDLPNNFKIDWIRKGFPVEK